MKRCIIGLILLAAMLVGGLLTTNTMARHNEPLAQVLTDAAGAALSGELDRAAQLGSQAREAWEKNRNFGAFFADHGPMEEIDAGLARLEIYANAGWEVEFAALCGELSQKLQAMGDAHGLQWWNIF